MRKLWFILGFSLMAVACGTSKTVTTAAKHKRPVKTAPVKPVVEKEDTSKLIHVSGLDFFKENIANISKNDNTISYGSIVSANPEGYTISKDHFPALGQNFRERYIILHYTALNDDKSLEVLTQQEVSAHYLVNDLNDQDIWQLVDENKRAYHAGVSSWGNDTDLNTSSIGIEIVNLGYSTDSLGQKKFFDYPDYQIKKVAALVANIAARYNVTPNHILGHSDIAPGRKQDPGPKFPWKLLYEKYGLGMWYDDAAMNSFLSQYQNADFTMQNTDPGFIGQIQGNLKKLGYGIAVSGQYDNATKLVVQAFQYHFNPQKTDGVMDAQTFAILLALVQKYGK